MVHKLALASTAALAAIGLAASTASAQGIEVTRGECDPCAVHVASTQQIVLDVHLFGIEFTDSICNYELAMVIYDDGTGEFIQPALTGSGCNRERCPATPWPFTIREDGPSSEWLEATFCLQPLGGGDQIDCTFDARIESNDGAASILGLHTDDGSCHGVGENPAEFSGEWITEGSRLHVSH